VDLDLSDDQEMFRATTRKFLEQVAPMARVRELWSSDEGFDRSAWAQAAELGWFAAFADEGDGGGSVSGRPLADASIVVEEAGRALFAGPVIPTNIVVGAIAGHGSEAQRAAHLPGLIGGETTAAWAFAENGDRWDGASIELRAKRHGDGFRLSGSKSCVQDAATADLVLVSAVAEEGLAQFLVPAGAAGMAVQPLVALDGGRRFADVRFDDVVVPASGLVGQLGGAAEAIERQRDVAIVLTCAETVGAVDRCFEMTLEYARMRKAFGRPIGSYQALKHRFADMLLWLEGSKAITVAAAEAADLDVDRAQVASVAKSYVCDRAQAIVRDCLQIHGGIGYTWEYDLHLFLRRVDSNAALYGGVAVHEDRLAALVGL
jgi:alkylation response protein AidB-like acyl-CoA dehydrogenase